MKGFLNNGRRRILSKGDGGSTPDSTERSPLLQSGELHAKLEHQGSTGYGATGSRRNGSAASCNTDASVVSTSSSLSPSHPTSLTWEHLTAYVAQKREGLCQRRKRAVNESQTQRKDGKKQVLFGVHGTVRPGQLLGMMGASGAGKTTLLNILAQRNTGSYETEGRVLVNGQDLGRKLTSVSAYVQQEDLFIGALTVREHLNFQALLRLPKTYTWKQKMRRSYQVLCELGLRNCQHTRIGIPGQDKGISGGEKKRLAFASEALTNPAIFFCDEPTTGLDSFMAEQVVLILKKMADHGKTVVCTIHQPASEVYQLLDSVYLIAEGRTVFSGPLPSALAFFEEQGYLCPKNFNPADFFVHTLAVIPGKEEECRERIDKISLGFKQSKHCLRGDEEKSRSVCVESSVESSFWANWFTQFSALLWRAFVFSYRNKRISFVRILQKILMGFLVGLLYFKAPICQRRIGDINGALFFMLMQVSMPAVMGILRFLPSEFPILVREHQNGMYSVSSYYWTKVVCYVPFYSVDGILFVCISYFMIGLRQSAGAFFSYILIIVLVEQTSAAFGTMLSVVAPDFATAVVLAAPFLTLVRLTSGMLANVGSLPPYISWMQYLSWWRFAYEATLINQWKEYESIECHSREFGCLRNGEEVLQQKSFQSTHFGLDLGMEVGLMTLFYLIGYLVLCFKVYRAR